MFVCCLPTQNFHAVGRKIFFFAQCSKKKASFSGNNHGGKSKGTTCVVDRDVTAYMVVDRVLRFPTE